MTFFTNARFKPKVSRSFSVQAKINMEESYYETFVDFDIDENAEIDKHILLNYNEFESVEVEIPEDLCIDDLDEEAVSSIDKECVSSSIPLITFVSDENISHTNIATATIVSSGGKKNDVALVCSKCSKCYKKKSYFEKHIQICAGKMIGEEIYNIYVFYYTLR